MGQQQLLLLVLGIVIVGLAVVVGIQAFGENDKKSNADAMVNDGVRIASAVQVWTLTSAVHGGGAGDPSGASFEALGFAAPGGVYDSGSADFEMTAGATSVLIAGENADNDNFVKVGVFGLTPGCIVTAVGSDEPPDPSAPAGCGF